MKDFSEEVEDVFESIGPDEVFMFLGVMIGVAVVFTIIALIIKSTKDAENSACPTESCYAQVIDKQQLAGNVIVSISQMWVLFQLEDGRRLKLVIPASKTIVVGDTGRLTWQGSSMISFTRSGSTQFHSQSSRHPTTPAFQQNNVPTWKRVEMMESDKPQNDGKTKCIFCGEPMADKQQFCGACGRKRD